MNDSSNKCKGFYQAIYDCCQLLLMLLTNSKLLADKQTDGFKMDWWQMINDKNLRSSHTQSHTCCWVSPELVSLSFTERKQKTTLLSLCHSINLTTDTNLGVLFTLSCFFQVPWNNIPKSKETNKKQLNLISVLNFH